MGLGACRSDTGGDGGGVDDGWIYQVGLGYVYHVGDRRDEYLMLGNSGNRILASVDCFFGFQKGIQKGFGNRLWDVRWFLYTFSFVQRRKDEAERVLGQHPELRVGTELSEACAVRATRRMLFQEACSALSCTCKTC